MKVLLVLMFLCISKYGCSINCPERTWAFYKSVEEGPWFLKVPNTKSSATVKITVNRTNDYRCFADRPVSFRTTRKVSHQSNNFETHKFNVRRLKTCSYNCKQRNDTVRVHYQTRSWETFWSYYYSEYNAWSSWSNWIYLGSFTYPNKNCDIQYWTAWVKTSSCVSSHQAIRQKLCVDCDGDEISGKYCGEKIETTERCNHYWSGWRNVEPCMFVNECDATGERLRKRECLYGNDGNRFSDLLLCFDSDSSSVNQSATMMEHCNNTNIPPKCSAKTSFITKSVTNNTSLYIGIGVALALIVLCGIFLTVMLHRRHKSPTNATPNQHPSTFELPVTRTITAESNGLNLEQLVIPNSYNCDQILSSHEYEHPFSRPIDENSQAGISTANELDQLPASHAYELEQSVVPNVYEFEPRKELNEYENAFNEPYGANLPTISQPTYSTVQEHRKSAEESNEYSCLARTNSVPESEYARLSSR